MTDLLENDKLGTEPEDEQAVAQPSALYPIIEHNDLIRNVRYTVYRKNRGTMLSVNEQRVWYYLLSLLKPDELPTALVFEISEFCKAAGIPDTQNNRYERVRDALESLMKKVIWLKDEQTGDWISLRYIANTHIRVRSGTVLVYLDQNMEKYTTGLDGNFTKTYPQNLLPMRTKYGGPLYRLLKSYAYRTDYQIFDLQVLQERLDATNYKPTDFRRRVLEPAVEDINTFCSDLKISFEIHWGRGGKKSTVCFAIKDLEHSSEEEDIEESHARSERSEAALNPYKGQQMTIWD